jgi:hypothetical protein
MKSKTAIEKVYSKMGMREITSQVQKKNGTRHFHDTQSGMEYVFRQYSAPRIQYWSDLTDSWQSYKLFEPSGTNINEDMKEAIPYIVNRKIKSVKARAIRAMNIVTNLI